MRNPLEKKTYQRNIRMTDKVREIVERFRGEGFNDKFENLVLFCMREEKELTARIREQLPGTFPVEA